MRLVMWQIAPRRTSKPDTTELTPGGFDEAA